MELRPRAAAPVTSTMPVSQQKLQLKNLKKQIDSLMQELKIVKKQAEAAEANAALARREKDLAETSLNDVQDDLVIQQETTMQVATMLDLWQSRFDIVCQLAQAAGVDSAMLRNIRDGIHEHE